MSDIGPYPYAAQYCCGHFATTRLPPEANIALCPACYYKSKFDEMWEDYEKRKYAKAKPWWKFW